MEAEGTSGVRTRESGERAREQDKGKMCNSYEDESNCSEESLPSSRPGRHGHPGRPGRPRRPAQQMRTAEARLPFKPMAPQDMVDEFWRKFITTTPGKGKLENFKPVDFSRSRRPNENTQPPPEKATTTIPQNVYAEKAATKTAVSLPERTTRSSYAGAAEICRTKVRKIAAECRAINRKYRDPHFDLELDFKRQYHDCLSSLSNTKRGGGRGPGVPGGPGVPSEDKIPFHPRAVKRVTDIFDEPQFFIDGPSTKDVRQGRNGDCWLLAYVSDF